VRYTDPEVARIKYGIVHDSRIALVADRTAGNLLEQLSPFLASTWLRAVLVPGAAASSGRLAWAYLLSRMAYPFAFYAGHPLLQVSTQPGYVIIWGQLADLAVSAGDKPAWYVKQEITRMNDIRTCTFTRTHNVSTTLPHSLKLVSQYNLFAGGQRRAASLPSSPSSWPRDLSFSFNGRCFYLNHPIHRSLKPQ
jgi:hypothetical protein